MLPERTMDRLAENPPTFVLPALHSAKWGLAFVTGMVAAPTGHTWAWFFLIPAMWHFVWVLHHLADYIGRKVYLDAGTPAEELPERLTKRLPNRLRPRHAIG